MLLLHHSITKTRSKYWCLYSFEKGENKCQEMLNKIIYEIKFPGQILQTIIVLLLFAFQIWITIRVKQYTIQLNCDK